MAARLLLLAVLLLAASAGQAAAARAWLRGPDRDDSPLAHARKALQCWRCNSGYGRAEQRSWNMRAAADNSHEAIETAVDQGAPLSTTTAAIHFSQEQQALAAAGWPVSPSAGAWFRSRWGRRRRS